MSTFIKCILTGRGDSNSESIISLNISGKSTVTTQKAGMTFDPSGYSFKAITNMGKEQIISLTDSNLEFFTDETCSSKTLFTTTTNIYVRYKNIIKTVNLAAEGITIISQELPFEIKNNIWYLKSSYCPIYNGKSQTINYNSVGILKVGSDSTISAINVDSNGYKLTITELDSAWTKPDGYTSQDVYWNIYPAKASIDLQGIDVLQYKNQKVIINDRVNTVSSNSFLETIDIVVTGAEGFNLPVTTSNNIISAQLTENNTKLVLSLKKAVIDVQDCELGSIQFTSPNFTYSFKVNGQNINSENNTINFVGNLLTSNIITDSWETIINNPNNYSLGDIKILETTDETKIAGTSKWQMQLVDKTDNVLTFYSKNSSNTLCTQEVAKQTINNLTTDQFKDFLDPIITSAYYITDNDNPDDGSSVIIEEQGRRQFFLGTSSQLLYSNTASFSKFNYENVLSDYNHWLDTYSSAIGNYMYYYNSSNKTTSVTLNTSYELPIRIGFKIAKDSASSIPTISEGATLNDLNNFISAKINGSTTATYSDKGFIPGSKFISPETFQLSDGTELQGTVYIANVDEINNIVTLQSSYLRQNGDIYLITTSGIFEKFKEQQSYKGSSLETIYSNMQVLNTSGLIQSNTIDVQNYVQVKTTGSQSPVNKISVNVGSCYLPSAAECGITTMTLNNKTYNIPTLGSVSAYPADTTSIQTIFDVSTSSSYWTRLRDNILYNQLSAYYLCGINQGKLLPAGWEDSSGTPLGESQRNSRYYKVALTPRFKIGG